LEEAHSDASQADNADLHLDESMANFGVDIEILWLLIVSEWAHAMI
jgi:hypothetical protein